MTWMTLVLAVGTAARITRLITTDTITESLRHAVLFSRQQRTALAAGQPAPPAARPRVAKVRAMLYKLVTCDWCAGFWVSVAVAPLVLYADTSSPWFIIPATALTLSYAVGLLASTEAT
ncbi:DUF1360 domain-containing protein [Prauserella sediminis]|nr:DUF1360 domain-containing protein [Prauserella sediminis]